jgi:hypothetical protein
VNVLEFEDVEGGDDDDAGQRGLGQIVEHWTEEHDGAQRDERYDYVVELRTRSGHVRHGRSGHASKRGERPAMARKVMRCNTPEHDGLVV